MSLASWLANPGGPGDLVAGVDEHPDSVGPVIHGDEGVGRNHLHVGPRLVPLIFFLASSDDRPTTSGHEFFAAAAVALPASSIATLSPLTSEWIW